MAPVYRTANHGFFGRWSPHMAYVLGFFAADGCMIENSRGGHFIEFNITDKKLLYDIRSAFGSNHAISIRTRKNPKHKVGYRLQIGSKLMYKDLHSLGFTSRKSLTLGMPNIPKKYVQHFVRGYFDGDGCVYFKRLKFADRKNPRYILQTVFSCGSFYFLAELRKVLSHLGIKGGSLKKKKAGNELALSHRDSVALYRIMYNNLGDSDIYLVRKYLLFTRAIETLYGKNAGVAQLVSSAALSRQRLRVRVPSLAQVGTKGGESRLLS